MERNSYNGDFERFLKDNANQYRMYPSERVWKGIHTSLHTTPGRYRFAGFLLLLLLIGSGIFFLISSESNKLRNKVAAGISGGAELSSDPASTENATHHASLDLPAGKADQQAEKTEADHRRSGMNKSSLSIPSQPVIRSLENTGAALRNSAYITMDPASGVRQEEPGSQAEPLHLMEEMMVIEERTPTSPGIRAEEVMMIREKSEKIDADRISAEFMAVHPTTDHIRPSAPQKNPHRINWQLHFTPTVSYRKLSENKQYVPANNGGGPISYTSIQDINQAVNHKPDIGFEVGVTARYPVSKHIGIKTGLQTNITRYGIRAYAYRTEQATITLNSTGSSYNANGSVITKPSNYRNYDGVNSNWLENVYVQLSAPIGADYMFGSGKGMQWGLSSSLQPTYLLGKKAYLISADYKNYVEAPELIRRWNMNADLEAFVNYSTGRMQWRVGPQVRYQLFSSFINTYPVKENLFDIGLKVGVSLTK